MSKIDDIFDDWDDEEEDITSVQTIYEYIEDRQKNINYDIPIVDYLSIYHR